MKKKNREKLRLITLRVCIGILCAFVIAVFIRSYYTGARKVILIFSQGIPSRWI